VQSFLREARTLVKFRHPNIVRVMAVFEANNTAYLVMEYEEGEEFKSYVQRGDGIDEQSLQSLVLRIVDGLDQVVTAVVGVAYCRWTGSGRSSAMMDHLCYSTSVLHGRLIVKPAHIPLMSLPATHQ